MLWLKITYQPTKQTGNSHIKSSEEKWVVSEQLHDQKSKPSFILRFVPSVSRNLWLLQPFPQCTTKSKAGAFIFNLQSHVLFQIIATVILIVTALPQTHPSALFPLFSFFSISSLSSHISGPAPACHPQVLPGTMTFPFHEVKKKKSQNIQGNVL